MCIECVELIAHGIAIDARRATRMEPGREPNPRRWRSKNFPCSGSMHFAQTSGAGEVIEMELYKDCSGVREEGFAFWFLRIPVDSVL